MSSIDLIIDELIQHWNKQDIAIVPNSPDRIELLLKQRRMWLPRDFIVFYSKVNGMEKSYPNYSDSNGFLFYPLDNVLTAQEEIGNSYNLNTGNVLIFADYLQKSWWYGVNVLDHDNYMIGLLPHKDKFIPITNSLVEFIKLYIEDSTFLYCSE